MNTQRVWCSVLAMICATSLLTSIRMWSTTRCQDGVIALLGARGVKSKEAPQVSLRSLFERGQLKLSHCSWNGSPKLKWSTFTRSLPRSLPRSLHSPPHQERAFTIELFAEYHANHWERYWRIDTRSQVIHQIDDQLDHQDQSWQTIETLFVSPIWQD